MEEPVKQIATRLVAETVSFLIIVGLALGVVWYIWGTTTVTSVIDGEEVDGCQIEIDGKIVGTTPYEDRLGFGHHKTTVTPPDDGSFKQEHLDWHFLTIMRGEAIEARFERRTDRVQTTVKCQIDNRDLGGCEVEVDGGFIGIAPMLIELEAGRHEIYVIPPADLLTTETEWSAERTFGKNSTITAEFHRLQD